MLRKELYNIQVWLFIKTNWCCLRRFTAIMEMLLDLREQLQKLQQQSDKYNSTDASDFFNCLAEIEKMAASLCTKLLVKWDPKYSQILTEWYFCFLLFTWLVAVSFCSALVVEKQPIMSSLPQRPLIVKTGVRFTVSVRWGCTAGLWLKSNYTDFKHRNWKKPFYLQIIRNFTK